MADCDMGWKTRVYKLKLSTEIVHVMVNLYMRDLYRIFGAIDNLDILLFEKIFWDLLDMVNMETSNLKVHEQFGHTLIVKRYEVVEDGRYIKLLKYLFKDACIDACLKKYLNQSCKI